VSAGAATTVSVVIPAFNAERYLGDAIESVLSQTCPATELLVVDDGSTDGTAAVAGGFGSPVRCVSQAHGGIGGAVNRGVELARGELLASLDADDVWLPDKLSLQLEALTRRPELDLVFGLMEEFHSPDLTPAQRARLELRSEPRPGICRGAMLIRRESFARVGMFATDWAVGEFVEWYGRAMDAGLRSEVLDRVLVRRRLHQANSTLLRTDAHGDYVQVLRTTLARRRRELR
jgi:glycosyltransferase involved in cell wall biosynthesis